MYIIYKFIKMTKEAKERKEAPVFSGVLMYFPDAILEVAKCSFVGNEQHNPGSELHWDRTKSQDEKDALVRHLMDAGKVDSDGVRHSTKVAWRALANLQKEIEAEKAIKEIEVVYEFTNKSLGILGIDTIPFDIKNNNIGTL